MRARILTFAQQAEVLENSKLTITGTIDGVSLQRVAGVPRDAVGKVPVPDVCLVVVLEGSIADGLSHRIGVRIYNEDHEEVGHQEESGKFRFVINRYGRPMRAQIIMKLQGLELPGPGDYEFQLVIDGEEFDSIPFYVTDETPDGA